MKCLQKKIKSFKLLSKDQKKRFGNITDANEIMAHPWFKDIDWKKLEKKEVFF